MVSVEKVDDTTFKVTVEGKSTTTHTVNLDPAYYQKLTGGKVTEEMLIEKSFEFLLERESNNSILSQFDLPVINRYFPEYENEMKKKL
ncbi:MAG: hypothetical protein GWN59_03210 [Calditrichae bacterium]|nr:hypothetical protein [Calditrichia bacterium]